MIEAACLNCGGTLATSMYCERCCRRDDESWFGWRDRLATRRSERTPHARFRRTDVPHDDRRGSVPAPMGNGMIDQDDTRYGVYDLRDGAPHLIAETSRDGIGLCLVTLAEDARAVGDRQVPALAVKDNLERRWISSLWHSRGAA